MPWATGPKIKLAGQPDPDALKMAAEIRKKQVENERFFADRAVAAGAAGKTGFAKEAEEMTAEIAKRTSFVDDHGKMHQVGLTPAALNSIMEEAAKKFDAYKEHVAQSNHKVIAGGREGRRGASPQTPGVGRQARRAADEAQPGGVREGLRAPGAGLRL